MSDQMPTGSGTYRWVQFDTAIGTAFVVVGPDGVRHIALRADHAEVARLLGSLPGQAARGEADLTDVAKALCGVIDGARHGFPFALDLNQGTPFQRQVWRELLRIPWGHTATYRQIAERLGRPGAARAVGQANARNPLPVVVPCHRVISAGGRLGGYTGGLDIKRHLLRVEGVDVG